MEKGSKIVNRGIYHKSLNLLNYRCGVVAYLDDLLSALG